MFTSERDWREKERERERERERMRGSKSSCFKIITCARGDSANDDDPLASPESKVSSDKRRWSFRKRSPGHQVPSGTVLSEPVCVSSNKENSEVTANNFHSPKSSSVSEKTPTKDTPNDVPPVSCIPVQSEFVAPLIPDETSIVSDHNIQESVVIIIQASIRGYLVRREVHKVKNVIKLQAAVRGHLVRRQAVGTLRCVQAIIRLQALIRARRAHMFLKKLDEQEDEKFHMDKQSPAILGKGNSCMKPDKKCTSAKSLLSNGFARQLLESIPKTKPIYINCDPSKSDSAWKWLERWMAVTLSDGQEDEKNIQDFQRQEENSKPSDYEAGNGDKLAQLSVTSDSKLAPCESTAPAENEMHLIAKNPSVFEVHDSTSNPEKSFDSVVKDDQDQSPLENEAVDVEQEKGKEVNVHIDTSLSPLSQMPLQTDTSELLTDSLSDKPGPDSNLEKLNMKASFESLDAEGKEFIVGPKLCNTVFTTGQSKFEDMITTSTVGRTISSAQDAPADLSFDSSHFYLDSSSNNKDLILAENSCSHDPKGQVAASECGTEISISSTLDSPERSEAEGGEIVLELGSLEKHKYDANDGSDGSFNPGNAETKSPSFHQEIQQPERLGERDQNPARSIPSSDVVQAGQQLEELTASYMQSQAENLIDQQIDRSSLKGTPRSHATATELHGTTSSQNSVNSKKKKKESRKSDGKLIPQIGNRSPSNSTKDSGGRSSTEQKQKDSKNAKRRSLLGIAKPEHVDQEPRLSTGNPLPSYMQATESAKAKAHASISPKSSPDFHNKDTYIKKRHSLPITNVKQGSSPRMQGSPSQAHQRAKGNDIHSPHSSAERSWQR